MKRILSIIILIVLLFILSDTNPGRSDYVDWVNHEAMDRSSNIIQKGMLSVAGKSVFDMATTHKNYFLFSIYKTDFSDIGLEKVTCIGIFNQFIPISKSE
jgi:hypothetical protein